ncbi:MAG TPA: hypothetical protein VF906_06735 [Candidatus Bathyarchaeia archaeon]
MSQMESTTSAIKRTVPVWSLFLVAILALGSVVGVFMADPQLANALSLKPTPHPEDFTLSSSQAGLNIEQGSTGTVTLTVTSINSYNNITWLSDVLPSNATSALTASLNPSVVTPPAKGAVNSTLTVAASPNAPTGNYPVTVTGTSGPKTHSVQLTITVLAGPGFILTASLPFMNIARGGANSTTILVTSLNGFTGKVTMTVAVPFAFMGAAGGLSPLMIASGTSNSTLLGISAANTTKVGTYYFNVTGASGSISRSVMVTANVTTVIISNVRESMGLDSYSFSSGTNVTMYLHNFGSVSIQLVTYYVKDASGNQYAYTAWPGPTIAPANVVPTNFLIGSSCSSCTLTGTAFTFTPGYSYTITVVTARNNQFTFSIAR